MLPSLLLLACAPADAEYGSTLIAAANIEVPWNDAYADVDGTGSLFDLQAAVLDPDGLPASEVRVEVTSGWGEAWVLPDGGARVAPGAPCEDLTNCEAWFDIERSTWMEVRTPVPMFGAADNPRQSYQSMVTDAAGIADFQVFVDTVPDSGASIPIFVSIEVETESFEIAVDDDVVDSL